MRKQIIFLLTGCLFSSIVFSQNSVKGNKQVSEGNEAYDKGDLKSAAAFYQKGLDINPKNEAAQINLALAQAKLLESEKSVQNFDDVLKNNKNNPTLNAMLNYDKGVALSKAKKYQEAIKAFKNALRIHPEDQNTRENLQKAINELKQQQQQQQKKQNQKKQQQQKQNDKQQDKQQQQKEQQQQQNQMSKKQAEQLLKALREQEKETQKKLNEQKASGGIPNNGKDW